MPTPSGAVWPLLTIDIDGTLTTVHGWKVLSAAFGRGEAFDRTQRRFLRGEIGEDEHLGEMLEVVVGQPLVEVERALAATPRLAGISDGVRWLHDRGTQVALLTHNPPFVCRWYCRTFGFDDFEGTGAQGVVHGIVQAPSEVRADKPAGLRALAARHAIPVSQVVHVGDGRADAALFGSVGRGVALNSALPDVERAADLALHSNDFREVAAAIEALRPRA